MCVYLLPYPHIHVDMTVGDLHATVYMDVWFLNTLARSINHTPVSTYSHTYTHSLSYIRGNGSCLMFDIF